MIGNKDTLLPCCRALLCKNGLASIVNIIESRRGFVLEFSRRETVARVWIQSMIRLHAIVAATLIFGSKITRGEVDVIGRTNKVLHDPIVLTYRCGDCHAGCKQPVGTKVEMFTKFILHSDLYIVTTVVP